MANASGLANVSAPVNQTGLLPASYAICDSSQTDENWAVGYLTLLVTCMASWKIAFFVSDNKRVISLPRGSGFLITGLLAGTFNVVKATARVCKITVLAHPDGPLYDERNAIFFPVRGP